MNMKAMAQDAAQTMITGWCNYIIIVYKIMSKAGEDELTKLKRERIERLEQKLQDTLLKVAEQQKRNPRRGGISEGFGGIDGFFGQECGGFGGGSLENEVSRQLKERLDFLKEDDLSRPISDKIIGPNDKMEDGWRLVGGNREYTKDEFMSKVYQLHYDKRDLKNIDIESMRYTIPSLDGIIFRELFYIGHGPITPYGAHYAGSGINLRRCRIHTLGNVQFPSVIDELNIGYNDIMHLQGVSFPSCRHLYLNSNLISSLHGCVFPEGIQIIHLQDNLISKFDDLNVSSLPMSLTQIHLSENPLTEGMTQEELEMLNRKILYKIAKTRYRAKQTKSEIVVPPASAPPLDFDGGSLQKKSRKHKKKSRKYNKCKQYRKYKKTIKGRTQ